VAANHKPTEQLPAAAQLLKRTAAFYQLELHRHCEGEFLFEVGDALTKGEMRRWKHKVGFAAGAMASSPPVD